MPPLSLLQMKRDNALSLWVAVVPVALGFLATAGDEDAAAAFECPAMELAVPQPILGRPTWSSRYEMNLPPIISQRDDGAGFLASPACTLAPSLSDGLIDGIVGQHQQIAPIRASGERGPRANAPVEPHGFTAAVPLVSSAESAEPTPPKQPTGLRRLEAPVSIPPRPDSRGFLRRRVNRASILARKTAKTQSGISTVKIDVRPYSEKIHTLRARMTPTDIMTKTGDRPSVIIGPTDQHSANQTTAINLFPAVPIAQSGHPPVDLSNLLPNAMLQPGYDESARMNVTTTQAIHGGECVYGCP